MNPTAIFSQCRKYRYTLWRTWGDSERFCMFIGLNPSTATETTDDPTLRKCQEFARRLGYSRMVMTNLYAYRATDPREMKEQKDPIGRTNDVYLMALRKQADLIIPCWGVHGDFWYGRGSNILRELKSACGHKVRALKLTKDGYPAHPLYLPYSLIPEPDLLFQMPTNKPK